MAKIATVAMISEARGARLEAREGREEVDTRGRGAVGLFRGRRLAIRKLNSDLYACPPGRPSAGSAAPDAGTARLSIGFGVVLLAWEIPGLMSGSCSKHCRPLHQGPLVTHGYKIQQREGVVGCGTGLQEARIKI